MNNSVEPDALNRGLARATTATMGSCQRRPRSTADAPRRHAPNSSAPASEIDASTGCMQNIVSPAMPQKYAMATLG